MHSLLEILPIIAFFAVFKLTGGPEAVYPATAAAVGLSALLTLGTWVKTRKVPTRQWVMLGLLVLMGGLTLAFHDPSFIQAKPTVVSWLTGLVFLGSQFIGKKTLVERAFAGSINAPAAVWRRLNVAWVAFFMVLGALNAYVAATFSMEIWVDFKVFGVFGLTLVFAVLQAFWLMRYDASDEPKADDA